MVFDILLLGVIFVLSAAGTYFIEGLKKKAIGIITLVVSFLLTWVYAILYIIGIFSVGVFFVGVIVGYVLVKFFKRTMK